MIADSQSLKIRELFKNKITNKANKNKSEGKSFYLLKNLLKTETIKTKDKLNKEFLETESKHHAQHITDFIPNINNPKRLKLLKLPDLKHKKIFETKIDSSSEKFSKTSQNVKKKFNFNNGYVNYIDRIKILEVFRNGIRQKPFHQINEKFKGRTKIKTDYNSKNYLYTFILAPKKINFMDVDEKFTCKEFSKFLPNHDHKVNSNKTIEKNLDSILRLKEKLRYGNVATLEQEINTISPKSFTLVSPSEFSSIFRNHDFNFNMDEELKIKFGSNPIKQSDNSLKKELIKEIETIEKEKIEEHKKNILQKWKKIIISAAIHFKKINLTLAEFFSHKFNSIKPYENQGSFELFQAVKHSDFKTVTELIEENKFLVHDYDYFYQTALHWAAKRNRFTIIPILIEKGANINSEDISGRTPLHIAACKNNLESLKILLYEMADPFKRDKEGKLPIDITNDNKCKFYLSRARILHIIHAFGSVKKSRERIKFGFEFFFNNVEKEKFA